MAEYIEREAAKRYLAFGNACPDTVLYLLDEVDAADVAPVVHGKWIMRGGKRYCSVCEKRAAVTRDSEDFWYTVGTDFCPNCGAKMDGERKGDDA